MLNEKIDHKETGMKESPHKKHILVVENEPNTLNTLEFILEAANFCVNSAGNVQLALEKMLIFNKNGQPVDLLLLDAEIPGLTILEMMDKLNHLNIDIPVFVIAEHWNKDFFVELMRKGCREYLEKPFTAKELVKRIKTVFKEKSESRNLATAIAQKKSKIDSEQNPQDLYQILASCRFFENLGEQYVKLFASVGTQISFQPGTFIVKEGQEAKRFFIILKGKINLEISTPSSESLLIQTVSSEDLLGWSWLVPPYTYQFDARVVEPTEAIALSTEWLRERIDEDTFLKTALINCFSLVIIQRLQISLFRFIELFKSPGNCHTQKDRVSA